MSNKVIKKASKQASKKVTKQLVGKDDAPDKPMTAEEYCEALAKLDLSQVAAAKLLGITDRSSRRYAHDREIPINIARTLRYLIATKTDPEDYLAAIGIHVQLGHYTDGGGRA